MLRKETLKELKDFDDINKELEEFSEELNQKEQWVVISKIDKFLKIKKTDRKRIKKLLAEKMSFMYHRFLDQV